jgi:hypothetical protein
MSQAYRYTSGRRAQVGELGKSVMMMEMVLEVGGKAREAPRMRNLVEEDT